MSTLPLFALSERSFALPEKSPLVGIARLASEGESLREGHDVEYFTLSAKSLLNRCVSRRGLPFAWSINPYRGCEFACRYCYARYTHEFMEMRDGAEFEQKIYVKQLINPPSAATKSRAAFSKSSPATAALSWGLSPSPTS